MQCKICSHDQLSTIYQGPIRKGRFGDLTPDHHDIWKCESCGSGFLDVVHDASFYESDDYRKSVDCDSEPSDFYANHDVEQLQNLSHTGTDQWRDQVVADVGCGAGSFLDFVSGAAKTVIAIEPSDIFRKELSQKGYETYPYANEALGDWAGQCDSVVTFSVLEHIADPRTFLRELYSLLKPGGRLLLSTPNTRDALLGYLGDEYSRFYFRMAHLWYFDSASLTRVLEHSGFGEIAIKNHQRFGLANFMNWSNHKEPTGNRTLDFITPAMDAVWKAELERLGRADYLFACATRP